MIRKGNEYTCDRCSAVAFVAESDIKTKWQTINRVNADKAAISRLLCPACADKYQAFAAEQDTAFNKFMEGE